MRAVTFAAAPLLAGLGFGTVSTSPIVHSTSLTKAVSSVTAVKAAVSKRGSFKRQSPNGTTQWPVRSSHPLAGLDCYRQQTSYHYTYFNCWPKPATTSSSSTGSTSTGSSTAGSTGTAASTGTTTAGTTTAGSTTTGSTSTGSTGSTTAGSTTAGSTTAGSTTAGSTGSTTTGSTTAGSTTSGSTGSTTSGSTGSTTTSSTTSGSTGSTTTGSTGSTSTGSTSTGSTSAGAQPVGVSGSWHMIFDDEFSNDSSLNSSEWTPYWFSNGATQNGTTIDSSNASVSGGSLNLAVNGSTGSLVDTNGKFSYTYGYAEARIYLPPTTNGSEIANWPAFWTDGQSWPTDGEQDIMEGLGGQACYHFHDPSGGPGGCASGNYSGWHTYGADWEPGSVTYYYDGVKVGTISQGITSSPMYLILENTVGSDGGPVISGSTMKVQYVRVWQH